MLALPPTAFPISDYAPFTDYGEIQRVRDSAPPPVCGGRTISFDPVVSHQIEQEYWTANPVNTEIEPSPVASRQKLILDLLPHAKKICRGVVFFFVSELEKEIQYIQYEDYLTHHCKIIEHDTSPDVIFHTLLETHQHDTNYNKFNKLVIWECVNNYMTKFRARYKEQKLYDYRNLLKSLDITWNSSPSHDQQEIRRSGHFSGLNIPDMSEELEAYKDSLYHGRRLGGSEDPKKEMFPRLPPLQVHNLDTPSNPVAELVTRLLGKTCVMDPNPLRELEKLEAHDPVSYGVHFTWWKSDDIFDQSEMVRVDNVPLDVTEDTMWSIFMSIGLTVHLEMTSGENSQTAFVIFFNPGTAEKAILRKDNIISGHSVEITKLRSFTQDNLYADDCYDDSGNDEVEFSPNEEDICGMIVVLRKYWNLCSVVDNMKKWNLTIRRSANGPDF